MVKRLEWLDIKEKTLGELDKMGLSLGEVIRIYKRMMRSGAADSDVVLDVPKKATRTRSKLHIPKGLSTTLNK